MNRINTILFGNIETFEEDPYTWMFDWGTRLFRSPLQRAISTFDFWFLNFSLLISITYIILNKPTGIVLAENLAMAAITLIMSTAYGILMRNFSKLYSIVQQNKQLFEEFTRPCSHQLKKKASASSFRHKIFLAVNLILVAIGYIIFACTGVEKTNLGFILLHIILHDSLIFRILIFGIVLFHSVINFYTNLFLCFYFLALSNYFLDGLFEQIDNLIEWEKKYDSNGQLLNQEKIKDEMVYFCIQYRRLKRTINYYVDFIRWRFLGFFALGAIPMATSFLYIFMSRSIQAYPFIACLTAAFTMLFYTAASGQILETKCEQLHMKLQRLRWYNWNRENKQLFIMFLVQTRKPLQVGCYDLGCLNHQGVVQMFRLIYTFITYLQLLRNH